MPYDVVKMGNKYVVQKSDGSRRLGTHDTKEEADRQLAALYAVENRSASNPEGINQYTGGGGSGHDVKEHKALLEKFSPDMGLGHTFHEQQFISHVIELGKAKEAQGWSKDKWTSEYKNWAKLRDASSARDLHLLGATGTARTEMWNGKEWLVVPVVALMEGVIHAVNAETPEFVPFETLKKAAASFNDKPIVIGHPKKDGVQCSASVPGVTDSVGVGVVRNSRVDELTKKMLQEMWIEKAKAKRLNPTMYEGLEANRSEEVSIGAYVVTDRKAGSYNGKPYAASWLEVGGDHLAILPGGRGACSLAMGCGTHRAAMRVCETEMELVMESIIDPETLRVLRDIPQSERDKMSASDFAGPNESFPIKTQADVDAAKSLIGKAADPEAVKRKIIAIAKRKGLTIPEAWRTAAAGDVAEESAELIAYQTMRTVLDTVSDQYDQVSKLVDDLISAEQDDPTETPADEAAEETVETSQLEAIRSLCQAMMGGLSAVISSTYCGSLQDDPARYMEGARNSKADQYLIQQMHDHATALGAACTRSNYTMAEGHEACVERAEDDPNKRYIAIVKKEQEKAS